ncbi:MAG: ABC transporter substrate-binding protein [Ruthenibacterium sp.]
MKKLLSLTLVLCLALSLAACGSAPASASAPESTASAALSAKPTVDRAGNAIVLPETVKTVVVLAPSIAETMIAMGDADKIIAIDTQTQANAYPELAADLPAFDMATPDAEQLAALKPDLILASGLSIVAGVSPFQPLVELGIPVACIPTSDSISGVYDDITFLGAALGREKEAAALNSDMKASIDAIAAIGSKVPDAEKKSVYFEIAAAPQPYSFGSEVYLNEMIELIGAKNVLADRSGWLSVEIESVLASNPDVILTNVNYIDNAVDEILGREGWGSVNAVKNKEVYYIDNLASSLANQNLVTALREMAVSVYPELYAMDKAA